MPFILVSGTALAVPCTQADFVPNANRNDCDSLIIDGPAITINSGSAIFFTNISGNVEINTDIILDGGNGSNDVSNGVPGGTAGPGADEGGGYMFAAGQPGGFGSASDGQTPTPEAAGCSNGGGGAGFFTNGQNGFQCTGAVNPVAAGGSDSSAQFDFIVGPLFRGGFGGGAGAYGATTVLGTGGGGGGALHIQATGTITIRKGVKISVRGGNGGSGTIANGGGGGGGGSGGAVWLISATDINLNGSIDSRGGAGGRNNLSNGHGGNGSDGRYRLEVAGVITDGHGLASGASSAKKLNSDISCGTIGVARENKNDIYQMMSGFALAALMGLIIKTLFRFPKKLLSKSAHQN